MSKSPTETVTSLLLFARFAAVEEPRRHAHKIVFPLELLLLIVFGAALSDMPGWQGAADFARLKEGWLRKLCPWQGEGTPSADTLERVMGMMKAEQFAECFSAWMREVAARRVQSSGPAAVQHIAVDGKSVQGARQPGAPTVPMHLVHTYLVQERGLLLGLSPAEGAPGEAQSAQGLLELLELKQAVVTADANLLTRKLTDTIVERGGHYVLALKGNRGPAHAQVQQLLCVEGEEEVLQPGKASRLCTSAYEEPPELGHGREQGRRAWAFDATLFPAVQRYLPHARSVLVLLRERRPQQGTLGFKASCESHFYVSTLPPTEAQALAGYVRAHWEIENLLHRQLDVVLHEDASSIGHGPGAHNLATVRRAALTALRADTTFKASMPRRVRQAAHDDAYRTHLLTQVIS